MRLLRSNRYVCEHTQTQHIHTAIMTVFVHGSLCSVTGSMTRPVMLDQHRLDSTFITSDFFFFFNSFTILVFLTLTLPNPLRGVQTSKDIFILSQKTGLFRLSAFFICAQTAAVSAGVCEPHCSTISITVLLLSFF